MPRNAYVDPNSARACEGGMVAQALGRDPSRSGSVPRGSVFPIGLVLRVTKNVINGLIAMNSRIVGIL
jgi:hypothetical protein